MCPFPIAEYPDNILQAFDETEIYKVRREQSEIEGLHSNKLGQIRKFSPSLSTLIN